MMPERKLSALLTFLLVFLCLNLSHGQNGAQFPAVPINPNVLNSTLPTVQATPGSLASRDGTTTKNDSGGKYKEYQSLCRLNEYDTIKYYLPETKKRRVELLKEKIAGAGDDTVKLKFRLIKEYIDQDESALVKPVVESLKKEKLSVYDTAFLNSLVFLSERNYAAAIGLLNQMLIEDKKNIEVLQFLAEVYMLVENYYEAGTIYEDLNQITKNAYLVQLCETSVLNSLNAEAEKICTDASNKFPENPFPVIYKGISHREREESKRAIFAFQKSIGLKPTEMGYVCLAEAFFMKGSLDDAAENFQNGLNVVSKSIRAMLGLAWTQLKLRNYAGSIAAFKKACLVNSKYEAEIRKALRQLADEKSPQVKQFMSAAESCGR